MCSVMALRDDHSALGAESPLVYTSYTWDATVPGETAITVTTSCTPTSLYTKEFMSEQNRQAFSQSLQELLTELHKI